MEIACNGGTLFCAVEGKGPPLLIPGYASTPRFELLVKCFGDEFTVIGHDVRGTGHQTSFPVRPFSVEDLADDSAAVVDALGFDRVHYLGSSHTGIIGQALALRYPKVVDRLVLSMTTPGRASRETDRPGLSDHFRRLPVPSGSMSEALASAELGRAGGVEALSALLLSTDTAAAEPALVAQGVEHVYGPLYSQARIVRQYLWDAVAGFNSIERLGEIRSPTLVLTSSGDRVVAVDDSWLLWRGIPRCTMIALSGVGHSWLAEAPELASKLISMFLRGELESVDGRDPTAHRNS